jgi:hypothetical protein
MGDLLSLLGQPGGRGEVKTPDLADVYIYDWESIFGRAGDKNRPQKTQRTNQPMGSMFAAGGNVQNTTYKDDKYANIGYLYDWQDNSGTSSKQNYDVTEELLKILRG